MTEKRLFGVVKGHREHIADHTGRLYSDSEVANLLNTVHEENEQLKNMVEHNYVEHKRCVNNYVDKIKEVEKENEQLKSEIKDLNDVLARYEEKFIKPVCKNGFDVDVNCTNGFTIITNKTELNEWINEQELQE